jgi:hypothetical protein
MCGLYLESRQLSSRYDCQSRTFLNVEILGMALASTQTWDPKAMAAQRRKSARHALTLHGLLYLEQNGFLAGKISMTSSLSKVSLRNERTA